MIENKQQRAIAERHLTQLKEDLSFFDNLRFQSEFATAQIESLKTLIDKLTGELNEYDSEADAHDSPNA